MSIGFNFSPGLKSPQLVLLPPDYLGALLDLLLKLEGLLPEVASDLLDLLLTLCAPLLNLDVVVVCQCTLYILEYVSEKLL